MTDIVVGVRLNADGSGLIGQLKLSKAELDNLRTSEKGAADAARDLSRATDLAAKSQGRVAQGARQAQDAVEGLTRNIGMQRAGWQQVGFQMQDVFASYASGTRLSVIFAQQSGQLASALALIGQSAEGGKGKLAGLASFLGGPWGIALGVAVSVVGALASKFLDVEKSADKASGAAEAFAQRQSDLASFIDKTTGRLAEQNKYLLQNAILLRQGKIDASSKAIEGNERSAFDVALGTRGQRFVAERQPFATTYDNDVETAITASRGNQFALADALSKIAAKRPDLSKQIAAINTAAAQSIFEAQRIRQQREEIAFLSGDRAIAPGFKPKADRPARKGGGDASEVKEMARYSASAAEAVAKLAAEFDSAPRDIDRAGEATRALDAIIGQVNVRLETGKGLTAKQREEFSAIGAEAARLKPIIQASLVRPILDMAQGQERQIALNRLTLAGRHAEAEALQLTNSLMDKMGVETEGQLAIELAKRGVTEGQVRALYGNLEVLRQQTREMRIQQQLQQTYLSAVGDMRENVRLTLQDLRQEGPKALGDFAKRSLDVFDRLFSEVAIEKLFGGLFRDLEDQITGGDKISKAGDKLADAVGKASKDIKQTSNDILALGRAASTATGMMSGSAVSGGVPAGWIVGDNGKAFDPNEEIVVEPSPFKDLKSGFKEGFEGVFDDLKRGFKTIFSDVFGEGGIFNASLAKTLGRLAGYGGLGGASGSLVTGLLGIQGSGTGGMIGGALGGKLGEKFLSKGLEGIAKGLGDFAGPLGSIAGGVLGSVVGGLLKKTKSGAANITSVDGDATLSGNSSAFKKAAGGAADSVQDALSQIAETLGGAIGAFNVTIGQRHDDWRVRSGTGSLKIAKGAKEFDGDQAGAIAYAIQLAVSQGAVTGISAAIDKALRSSDDINEALTEALKVQEIEQMLGGLGSEMAKQFRAFEAQAKDRLRIATQYGFDVVKIEAKSAEDRAAFLNSILTERVGSLQTLLSDLKYGDLFAGSLADQRAGLKGEIDTTRKGAEAGVDGAADKLSGLLRQLLSVTESGYGTAGGELASDRDLAVSAAEAVVKAENERIRAAQDIAQATNAELQTISSLTTEGNDLLTKIASGIDIIAEKSRAASSSPYLDYSAVTRGQIL